MGEWGVGSWESGISSVLSTVNCQLSTRANAFAQLISSEMPDSQAAG
jgi:hypothetical protein